MISLTAEYLGSTMHRLPDFYAKRISVRYEENPEYKEGSTRVEPKPTHEVEHSKATVLYRNGSEVLEAKAKQSVEQDRYLITYGTFGPLLRAVMDPDRGSRRFDLEPLGDRSRGAPGARSSGMRFLHKDRGINRGGVVFPTATER